MSTNTPKPTDILQIMTHNKEGNNIRTEKRKHKRFAFFFRKRKTIYFQNSC